MKYLSLAIGCAALTLASHTVHAFGPHSPGYLGLAVQHSLDNDELEGGLDEFGIKTSTESIVYGLYAGLAITPGMALELGYNNLAEIDERYALRGTTERLNVKLYGYQLGLAFNQQITPNTYLDMGIGGGMWYVKTKYSIRIEGIGSDSGSETDKIDNYMFFRGGFGYQFTPSWRASIVYQRNYLDIGESDSDFSQVLMTVSYDFGATAHPNRTMGDRRIAPPIRAQQSNAPSTTAPQTSATRETPRSTITEPAPASAEPAARSLPAEPPQTAPRSSVSSNPATPSATTPVRPVQQRGAPRSTSSGDPRCTPEHKHLFGLLCE